jgi:hypothetical protein
MIFMNVIDNFFISDCCVDIMKHLHKYAGTLIGYSIVCVDEIFQTMDALLLGCRDEDENIHLACADCIGAIGAVDPGHLSWRELQSSKYFRLNCWVLHPVARVSTNAFLKTIVHNNVQKHCEVF